MVGDGKERGIELKMARSLEILVGLSRGGSEALGPTAKAGAAPERTEQGPASDTGEGMAGEAVRSQWPPEPCRRSHPPVGVKVTNVQEEEQEGGTVRDEQDCQGARRSC